jgi:hypothetical protein
LVLTTPPGSPRTLEAIETSSPCHSPRILISPPRLRLPQPTYHMTPGIIQIPPSVSSQSTPQSPHLGMRTNSHSQQIANPYNWAMTSITVPLLQVVMLINKNGFTQSFMTAYVHAQSVLHLMDGTIQAIPNFWQEWSDQCWMRWQWGQFQERKWRHVLRWS